MGKHKRKRFSSKRQKSRTQVRDTGEHCQPPQEGELSLYGWSDIDNQIERLINTLHFSNEKGDR